VASSSRQPYRPALDGVRVIAVLLVIAFHAGMRSLRGGFVGVDVFFVLSGFLITRLLVAAADGGGIRLVDFYARRVRRLLPAALVMLLVTGLAWVAMASAVEREPLVGDVRSAALYFSNWHFAAQSTDYFAVQNAPSPLEHFWSLSVEEQFYGLWPAIVAAAFLLCRRDLGRARRWLMVVAGVLLVGSLAALVVTTRRGDAILAYYGTHVRAYQLLAGGLLALWCHGEGRHVARGVTMSVVQLLSLAGVLVVASVAVQIGVGVRGVLATGLSVALLGTLEADPLGAVARPLSWSSMAYLGQISYGTYLWHWPIIVIVRRFAVMTPGYLFLVAALLSCGLAALSHRVLEQPILRSRALATRGRLVFAAGLAASAAVGVLVLPLTLAVGRTPAISPIVATASGSAQSAAQASPRDASARLRTGTPVPSRELLSAAGKSHTKRTCLQSVTRLGCLAGRGTGPTMLLIGDSHVEVLLPVFEALAARHDITLYTWMYYVCPWQRDVLPVGTNANPCRNNKAELYGQVLPAVRPDVVVTVNRGYDDPKYPRDLFRDAAPEVTTPGKVLSAAMDSAVDSIRSFGARLVVVEPWPSLPFNQRECLSRSRFVEECAGIASGKLPSEQALEARAAARHDVAVVDLDKAVCPRLPACDAVVEGVVVRHDQDHVSVAFATILSHALDSRLTAAGAFEAAKE